MAKNKTESIVAIIEEGCHFEGNLSFNGTARVSGVLTGSIFTNGTLIISEAAVINADITADVVLIAGSVNGNIEAASRVEMRRPAYFEGTINAPSLVVEEGVIFHGTTKMHV